MKRAYWVIVLIGLFVLVGIPLSAQDTSGDTLTLLDQRSVIIRPLEDVTESAAQILDIASDSVRLNFVGKVPLACTVVYGTTTAFGSAAVDLNMNGGAIVEHNPVMLHLQPDTEYFYRLQGSGEDGTLYVSQVGSFRTLPQSAATVENLLSPQRGAQVLGVSSNYGGQPNDGTWGILNAFDGNPNTAWASSGDGDKAWFEVKLAQTSHVTRIEFWSRVMADKTSEIFEFTVTTDSGAVYGPFKVESAAQSFAFPVDFVASTLRFDVVSSSGGNTGALEVAVYGEPA
jgi:F5/8 type C domain-containing protein